MSFCNGRHEVDGYEHCVHGEVCCWCGDVFIDETRHGEYEPVRSRSERIDALESANRALREALMSAARFAHDSQCSIQVNSRHGCDCGADEHNARIDEVLERTKP